MAANHKLTGILRGRTATRLDRSAGTAMVQFDDGSVMTVQTSDDTSAVPSRVSGDAGRPGQAAAPAGGDPRSATAEGAPDPLGRVHAVRQDGTTLSLDFDTGPSLTLRTAEATSSVVVRAHDHSLEYAD
jgi:hypothetical protein